MRRVEMTIGVEVYEFGELSRWRQDLIHAAIAARNHVQAPYSKFHVGAAGLFADGEVFGGVNVENASYSQTTHGEQCAIVSAKSGGNEGRLSAMAVVGGPGSQRIKIGSRIKGPRIQSVHDFSPSCGHCLQVIWEQCDGDRSVELIALHRGGEIGVTTIGHAYPMAFGPKDLGIDVFAAHRKPRKYRTNL